MALVVGDSVLVKDKIGSKGSTSVVGDIIAEDSTHGTSGGPYVVGDTVSVWDRDIGIKTSEEVEDGIDRIIVGESNQGWVTTYTATGQYINNSKIATYFVFFVLDIDNTTFLSGGGPYGSMQKTIDNGFSWNIKHGGADYEYYTIYKTESGTILSELDSYEGGVWGNRYIIKSSDDGENWTTKLALTNRGAYRDSITECRGSLLFACYSYSGGIYDTHIYESTDDGDTWNLVKTHHDLQIMRMTSNKKTIFGEYRSGRSLTGYQFKSNTNLYSFDVMGTGDAYYKYYNDTLYKLNTTTFSVSPDGGKTWGVLLNGSFPRCMVYGDMRRYNNIIALTTGEGVYISTDRGGSFNKLLSGSWLSVNFSVIE